jgi:hypothetical protein
MANLPVVNQAELSGLLAEALKIAGLFAGGVVGGPAGYAAVAINAAGIWNEVANIINTGNVPVEDITAAHADAQQIHDARTQVKPADPSTVEYNSQPEAIAAVTPAYPNVQQLADGKFIVWPQIAPMPGTHIYP